MIKTFILLCTILPVWANDDVLYLDSKLIKTGDKRLAFVHCIKARDFENPVISTGPRPLYTPSLRFIYIVPKLGQNFKGGFKCKRYGLVVQDLDFMKLDEGEVLSELADFSNLLTWHATMLTVWGPGGLFHKSFVGVRDNSGNYKINHLYPYEGDLFDQVADFVKANTNRVNFKLLMDMGVASHILVHKLHKRFAHML